MLTQIKLDGTIGLLRYEVPDRKNKMNFKRDTDYNEAEIDRLISWIKTLKILGKTEMLHTLKKLKPYARVRPLKDSPETSLFTILNRIGYLDESEELCLEND